MRIVLQRVLQAQVQVNNQIIGKIQKGILVLFGCHQNDTLEQAKWLAQKLVNLRIFADSQGKMNLSLLDIQGEVLLVPQFTLYADCLHGKRPSFTEALEPQKAKDFFAIFVSEVKTILNKVQTGEFGAHMQVSLINDGPVTFIIDAK
jgi:D-tyrosyl-tRNA(Tyr) deacylase